MNIESLKEFANQKVLIYGDFMVDKYIGGHVSRISPEAPVPVLEVQSVERRPGGAGNVAMNVISLGAYVRALSCIGEDSDGEWLCSALKNSSVDTTYLRRDTAHETISKTRIVSKHQQIIRLDEEKITPPPDSFMKAVLENIDEILDGISVVIVSDYRKGAVTPALSQKLIQSARKRSIPVVVDPKGKDFSKYSGATACTPNTHELEIAAGISAATEEEINNIAKNFCQEFNFENLVITRSEKGISLVKHSGAKTDFPANAKEIIDVTGAGDTVVAVLALGLASGCQIEDCCILANHAASIVISKFGVASASISELIAASNLNSSSKHISADEASQLASDFRRAEKQIVFTNGCFDLLHAGHIAAFKQARTFGDVLFVGVNSDASVRRIKGKNRPIVGEKNRVALLCALACVDYVVVFNEDTPCDLINKLQPHVTVKGKDWQKKPVPEKAVVEAYGGRVEFIELEQGLSTSSLIEKIKNTPLDRKS